MSLGKTIKWAIAFMIFISLGSLCLPQQPNHYVNAQLPWHQAVLDSQGRLLAWYGPEKNLGYDHVVRLAWNFIEHTAPIDPKVGVKVYLILIRCSESTGSMIRPCCMPLLWTLWQGGTRTLAMRMPSKQCKPCSTINLPMGQRLPIGTGRMCLFPPPATTAQTMGAVSRICLRNSMEDSERTKWANWEPDMRSFMK